MTHNLTRQNYFEKSSIISYKWPQIYVPNTSFTRYIVEKFLFYSNQIFVIDSDTKRHFTYKHVLLDSLKTARILQCNNVTSKSTLAIVGDNSYEHVCTLFAAFLLDASIVLIDGNASEEQISAAVRKCGISYLAVIKSNQRRPQNSTRMMTLTQKYKDSYSLSFGDSPDCNLEECLGVIRNFTVLKESPINSKYLGLQRVNDQNSWNRTRVIVPKFRGSKVLKMYRISEYSLMSQLTYATLPQSGFEWNINDMVLNMWPFSNLLGILELLVTFSVGARIVLQRHDRRIDTDDLVHMVQTHAITACVLHSAYLFDLVKSQVSLGSLEKILYTEQPIHRNIVSVFRKKYIHNCRYGYFLLEASGFAAIEVLNYTNNTAISVTPLPSMEILVVNRETGMANKHGQLGKIFIRSPYCASTKRCQRKEAWVYSGYVGYYDNNTYLQVIDQYRNFIKSSQTFISKTLVETVLLSHPSVLRAVAMKNCINSKLSCKSPNEFQAYATLRDDHSISDQTLSQYLNSNLNDSRMKWTVIAVDRLARTAQHRIVTSRLRKVNDVLANIPGEYRL